MSSYGVDVALAQTVEVLESWRPDEDGRQLARLAGRTSASIDGLVGLVDQSRIDRLRSVWWRLEVVDALVLGDDRASLRPREVEVVTEARSDLLLLLADWIGDRA